MSGSARLVLSAAQAKELFLSKPDSIKLIDASWFMPNSPRDPRTEFEKKRLKSAAFWDSDQIASPHPLGLKHMMPDASQFQSACMQIGIRRDDHVLVYDTHGLFSSPRALFTFRAFGYNNSSVINGGLPACITEGFPTEEDEMKIKKIDIEQDTRKDVQLDSSVLRDYQQIVSNSKGSLSNPETELVFDARSRGRWAGTAPEPRAGMQSGHIPNSLSVPFNILTETVKGPGGIEYTKLLDPPRLEKAFKDTIGESLLEQVLEGKRSVVNSCGSGMTAAIIWLALQLLGVKSAIYDESWTGYASRKESRIEKEKEV